MQESQKNLLDGLHHLATICQDGEKGYKKAADEAKEGDLKSTFNQYSLQRSNYVTELNFLIDKLGGNSNQQESDLGDIIHRTWLELKENLNGHDRQALLSSCKRGDEVALEAYNNFFGDVFEYTSSPTTHSLYTITGGRNRNYEATSMDSGNGLYNSSEGFSNTGMGTNHPKSDYSSASDDNLNNISESSLSNSKELNKNNSDENMSEQKNTEDNKKGDVYSIVKAQLDGIESAHNKILLLQEQRSE